MFRSTHEQISHDDMVRETAQHFTTQGYTVAADIPGYAAPPIVNGHRPDVAVYSLGRLLVVVEVETESTYDSSHTYSQFRAFYHALGVYFHATVPRSVLSVAQQTAANWGVPPSKWWYV